METQFLHQLEIFETQCKVACDNSEFIDRTNAALVVALMNLTTGLAEFHHKLMETIAAVDGTKNVKEAAESALELLDKVAEFERKMP